MKHNYFNTQPVQGKAIAKECQHIFCKTYKDMLRYAVANNNVGTNHIQLIRIANKQSVIILN